MKYTVELTQQEIHIINMGLGELPLKLGINLLGKIQAAVQAQDAAKAVPIFQVEEQEPKDEVEPSMEQ